MDEVPARSHQPATETTKFRRSPPRERALQSFFIANFLIQVVVAQVLPFGPKNLRLVQMQINLDVPTKYVLSRRRALLQMSKRIRVLPRPVRPQNIA